MRWMIAAALALVALAGCAADDDPAVDDVSLTSVPETAQAGSTVEVCWQVDGSGEIGHTALHWDTDSHPGDAQFSDYTNLAWPGGSQRDSYDLPGEFCASFTMPSQDVYLRSHAMIEAPGTVSSEGHIQVSGAA